MAVFKFIKETYESEEDMRMVIEYCRKKARFIISPNMVVYSTDVMYNQFLYYRKYYCKEDGNRLLHFVLSFDSRHWERWVSWQTAQFCAMKICGIFEDYQTAAFIHTKKEHLHIHFLLNTVSFTTGKKFHIGPKEFQCLLKEVALMLSLEHIALLSVSYFNETGKLCFGCHDEDSLYLNSPFYSMGFYKTNLPLY